MDTSKVFVLNKLDKIYKRQLSFHQAQLDRYHKAAELRRLSGQHQQEINSLGKKWQTTIKTIQAERKMSQPDKNKKIEDFKEESKRRKLSRQKTILNFTYQREMSIFMERYNRLPKTAKEAERFDVAKKESRNGQLFCGSLEDVEDSLVNSATSFGSSFLDSGDSLVEDRFVQSATVRKNSDANTEMVRSRTIIGGTRNAKSTIQEEDQSSVRFLADVELEKPKLPAALYFTRGDGSFITGREQMYITRRMTEKHNKLKSHSSYHIDCKSYLSIKRSGSCFLNAYRSGKQQVSF